MRSSGASSCAWPRGTERLVLLALGGATEHVGRDGEAWTDWDADGPSPPQEIPLPQDLPA